MPAGIKVLVVDLGAFRTDFAGRSLCQSPRAIEDYAETAGLRRIENDVAHGSQIGDPTRAAEVLLEVIAGVEPPFRLTLGSDAIAVIRDELEAQLDELDRWTPTSLRTDFPVDPTRSDLI